MNANNVFNLNTILTGGSMYELIAADLTKMDKKNQKYNLHKARLNTNKKTLFIVDSPLNTS